MKRIVYILPDIDFFDALSGRVSHAKGIIDGLCEVAEVEVVSEHRITSFCHASKAKFNTFDGMDHPSLWRRLKSTLVSLKLAKKINKDIVLVRKTLFSLFFSLLDPVFGLKSKNYYWEVNGLSAEGIKGHKLFGFVFESLLLLNKLVMRRSRGVYVVNQELKDSLSSGLFSIDKGKILVITNGGPQPIFVQRDFEPGTINFVFFGVFQKYNNFNLVLDSFHHISQQYGENRTNLHIIGQGILQKDLIDISKPHSNVFVHPPMTHSDLSNQLFVRRNCVGLIPLVDSYTSTILSPIKMFDYMSLGMPVIMSSNVNLNGYKLNSNIIFKYAADDDKDLNRVFGEMLNCKLDWNDLSNEAYQCSISNTWHEKMKSLYSFMSEK